MESDVVMERRLSTDSTDSSNCSKQGSDDISGVGRIAKTTTPKPPANALQFIKTGPCPLYRKAQEQIKKAEEVKKETQHVRNDTEEWQSNLDNWKYSRRKRQEHIIERVVEVKKLELEEHERNRRRSKTFSEMMQERSLKGRKTSIPIYEDYNDDLSDLGLSRTNSEKEQNGNFLEDSGSDNDNQVFKEETNGLQNGNLSDDKSKKVCNGDSKNKETKEDKKNGLENNDNEEYTYERAIQNYVNFTETRVKSRSARSIPEEVKSSESSVKDTPKVPSKPRPSLPTKPDNSFSKFELYKKSVSTNDLTETNKKVLPIPKIDISKRKELFEKAEPEDKTIKINRSTVDLTSSQSIKERLSFLEKQSEIAKNKTQEKPPVEVSVKDRLSSIEKLKPTSETPAKNSIVEPVTSIKDRLSNLEKAKSSISKSSTNVESATPLKERLSSLQSACQKEVNKTVVPKVDTTFHEKLNTFQEIEVTSEETYTLEEQGTFNYSTEEIFESKKQMHFRHRSLDSLDVDSVPSENFERVQSYEDLEYCRYYPASSVSGDTDREDSGIHTADVSSSVSQADDFDLHLDSNLSDDIKLSHQPTITEEHKPSGLKSPNDASENVSGLKTEPTDQSHPARGHIVPPSPPLPAILENPAESSCSLDITPIVNILPDPLERSGRGDAVETHPKAIPSSNISDVSFCSHGGSEVVRREKKPLTDPDRRRTVIEVCEKVDTSELKTPLPTPFISVNTLSSADMKTLNGFEESDSSSSSETNEVNNSNILEETVLEIKPNIDEVPKVEPQLDNNLNEKSDTNDILNTTNQIILNSLEQSDIAEDVFNLPKGINIAPNQGDLIVDLTVISDSGSVFPLSPTALEPPKEKPPPPPTEMSDDDLDISNDKLTSMRRLDSTKRIKKEIRLKRSSFLGLDGDENDIEPELELTRPPDITALLTEERRLERQLYRQSLCSETDSNQESRDSGVELDNKPQEQWSHSRNNSDNFGNQSTTSDEDEIIRKEREIIETLEKEERIRKQQLGEKLAMRLRELEVEKNHMEWERLHQEVNGDHHQENESNNHPSEANLNERNRYSSEVEKEIANPPYENMWYEHNSDSETSREPGYIYNQPPPPPPARIVPNHHPEAVNQTYQQQAVSNGFQPPANKGFQPPANKGFQPPPKAFQPPSTAYPVKQPYQPQTAYQVSYAVDIGLSHQAIDPYPQAPYRNSYHDLPSGVGCAPREVQTVHRRSMPELPQASRRSMPDLQQISSSRPIVDNRRPPPPALPAKPPHLSSIQPNPQQMTRQTLQALSAAPRSRIISNESWQAKRKPKQENCNYQHWLIQEAEHRRITEQQKRQQQQQQQQQQQWVSNNPSGQVPPSAAQWSGQQHKPVYTSTPAPPQQWAWVAQTKKDKPLPDSIIQTLTQRVQNRKSDPNNNRRRHENIHHIQHDTLQDKVLSVSGKKRCSACGEELGRGAAMIIESLQLFYHIDCFKCCVCCMQLGDGLMGTDVRVRNNKLHCHNCYSSDDGVKFSCV